MAQGLGMRSLVFGGAYWPLATAHSDLTLCGPERVLVVSTEPPDDLSCFTTPGVGCPGPGGGWGGRSKTSNAARCSVSASTTAEVVRGGWEAGGTNYMQCNGLLLLKGVGGREWGGGGGNSAVLSFRVDFQARTGPKKTTGQIT